LQEPLAQIVFQAIKGVLEPVAPEWLADIGETGLVLKLRRRA